MQTTRRQFLSSLAAPGVLAAQKRPLNFVVILADDLGWSDLACYGADLHETPNLDRLAKEGIRFTDAHSASPVCSPTRASLMTGKHPARLGITIWRESTKTPPKDRKMIPPVVNSDLPLGEVTLADLFQKQDYLTAAIGKWHLGDGDYYPETQGFDINIGGTHWGAPDTYWYPYKGKNRSREYRYVPHLEFGKTGEYLTDRLTDEALQVIDRANKPFFLYLAHHAPHTPIQAPEDLVDHYRRKRKPGMKHQNATFAAMVHNLDANVGRVMRHLEQRNLMDRTVFLFLSDNGGYTGVYEKEQVTNNAPLRSGKGSAYEGGIRIPFIFRLPDGPRGVTCDVPITTCDVFATLQEIAGLQGPQHDGVSLVPLLRNPKAKIAERNLYFHYPHYYVTTTPVSAIRSGDWKMLRYYEDNREELYRLDRDLGESQDLSSAEPEVRRKLGADLTRWLAEVNAPMPSRNTA